MSNKRPQDWAHDDHPNVSQATTPHPDSFNGYDETVRHEASNQVYTHRRRDEQIQVSTNYPTFLLAQPGDRNFLAEDEFILCSNIEMFPASSLDVHDSSYTNRPTVRATSVGQLGIRCINCGTSPMPGIPYPAVFPSSINNMSASILLLAEDHILNCGRTSHEIKDAALMVSRKRKRRREDDNNLMTFCCNVIPRRFGIDNLYPPRIGVRFPYQGHEQQEIWHHSTPQYVDDRQVMQTQRFPQSHLDTPGRGTPSGNRQIQTPHGSSHLPGPQTNQMQHFMYPSPPSAASSMSPPSYGHYSSHPSHTDSHGFQTHHSNHNHRYDITQAFIRDAVGNWTCRYCYSVPYQYRAPNSVSQTQNPPSPAFIEHHLQYCRGARPISHHPQMHHHSYEPASWGPGMISSQTHPSQHESHPDRSHTPPNQNITDSGTVAAIQYLINNTSPPTTAPLVYNEDKTLLTDYFFHLMQQLQLCQFSESDRKTRGGKRENVKIGFGGLECMHCANVVGNTLSRKFFWSNVDRLANSFAEIPSHVLKCRNCPAEVKSALGQLKLRHPEQMAQLPRGSQKVFFRRMWRRMHFENDQDTPRKSTGLSPILPDGSGTPLSIPEDSDWLSDMDCFVRKNLEAFCATEEDMQSAQSDRKYPIHSGQVGIRCRHCAKHSTARGNAVSFPYSISGIYESVREFQRLHLDSCPHLSDELKEELKGMKTSTSLSSVLRRYYVLAAKALGMTDTQDGIRAGGEIIPIGSVAEMIHGRGEDRNHNRNLRNQREDDKRRKIE